MIGTHRTFSKGHRLVLVVQMGLAKRVQILRVFGGLDDTFVRLT